MDKITIKSGTLGFTISPTVGAGAANGKISGIRVQDIAKGKWFNYDEGEWDEEPIVAPGKDNLYIAFWVVNEGETGNLTLTVEDNGGVLANKTVECSAGEGLGVEWTGDMPSWSYVITLGVVPNDIKKFTIKSTGWVLPIPWWQVGLIILAAVGIGGGAAYYKSRKKKPKERY